VEITIDAVHDYYRNWTHEYTSAIWNTIKAEENIRLSFEGRATSKSNGIILYDEKDPLGIFYHRRSGHRFWHAMIMQTLQITLSGNRAIEYGNYIAMHYKKIKVLTPSQLFFQVMHSYDKDFERKYYFVEDYLQKLDIKNGAKPYDPFDKNKEVPDVTTLLYEIDFDINRLPDSYCRRETFINKYRIYEHRNRKAHDWISMSEEYGVTCLCNQTYYTIADGHDNCIFCGSSVKTDSFARHLNNVLSDKMAAIRLETGIAKRGPISPKVKMAVINRDGLCCQTCGVDVHPKDVVMAHIVSVSYAAKVGMKETVCNSLDNLIVSCRNCNAGQGKKPMSSKWYENWTRMNKIAMNEKVYSVLKTYDTSRASEYA
jgi:hypothetical protein